MDIIIKDIIAKFEAARSPEKSVWMTAYLKDQFECYGVAAPIRKKILSTIKPQLKPKSIEELLELSNTLWSFPYRELHYLAIDILQWKKKELSLVHLPQIKLLIEVHPWWDSVDGIASHLVGHILSLDKEAQIKTSDDWLNSGHMWLQRSIIIHQLRYKEDVDEKLLYESILHVMPTKEFFLQKAAGWALRSYSAYNPKSVQAFVQVHTLPALTVREGLRRIHLDK